MDERDRKRSQGMELEPERTNLLWTMAGQMRGDEEGLRSQVCLIMVPTNDTTSMFIANCIWYLARNPDSWEKLRQEFAALGKDAPFTFDVLRNMPYLNGVMNETSLAGTQVSSLAHRQYVTDWQKREALPLTTPPLDVAGLFRPDKTYLMVGAAGGLGFSICKWALANGAKHMVITSRIPRIDPAELEDARRSGATVQVLSMDVASRTSVEEVQKQISKTMPPIAGVCNAAMVLSDKLFLDMSDEQLNGTLKPKVDGSENLDAVFGDDADLDFFVMLSSSAMVLGNIGQANYHIANLYMGSIAARRRARGLAGSIIHVGHITDVGYVVESKDRTAALEEHFRTIRLMPLSETDVHNAFAEAIRCGRPGRPGSHDIIMGVEPASEPVASDVVEATESKIPWLANPRLGHLVPLEAVGTGAETEEEAVAEVLRAFCAKLEATLQLSSGQAAENAQAPVIDLAIDSLVAVEIRTWFLKELGAEVPVLKVLGGDSALQICTTVARTVMAKRIKEESDGGGAKAEDRDYAVGLSIPAPNEMKPVPVYQDGRSPSDSRITTVSVFQKQREIRLTKMTSPSARARMKIPPIPRSPVFKEKEGVTKQPHQEDQSIVMRKRPELIRQERMSRTQARIWFLIKHLDDPTA
ncbi:Nonribosomal peptide synthetase 14 [Cytospora mali]|uniref:Nonribosomal peptide synthetase 14 n=1 Tax=Cytospora mali TaxID=578113 RepID=A0A194W5E7_CYTMA|nr:Nonribosomal peptide synthetase 14 [Valsa mali]